MARSSTSVEIAVLPQRHLTFVGVAHPATRCAFALLGDVLAADDVRCVLDTGVQDDVAGERIYLRADASDAVALAAAGEFVVGEDVAACRVVARIAAAVQGLPTISIDAVLTDPFRALSLLPSPLPRVAADRIATALQGRQAALLDSIALCRHPLAFIHAVEPDDAPEPDAPTSDRDETIRALERGGFAWGSLDLMASPSRGGEDPATSGPLTLVVSADPAAAVDEIMAEGATPVAALTIAGEKRTTSGGAVRLLLAAAPASGPWPAIPARFDRVHLHHVADSTDPSALWRYAMAARGPRGIVTGREPNAGVVQQMLAKLMRDQPVSDLIFELAGSRWAGVPSSAWQA